MEYEYATKGAVCRWLAFVAGIAVAASASAAETVAIRGSEARFLRATEDGLLKATAILPSRECLFKLEARDGGAITLKSAGGRFVVAEDRDAHCLRADSPRAEPGERETFQIVPLQGNRVALKAKGFRSFAAFSADAAARGAADPAPTAKPRPEEVVDIFLVSEIPSAICDLLSTSARSIVDEEIHRKPYDKVRSRKVERSLDLPAPTLHDPRRTRSRRVLSVIEEYHVRAELDGKPEIEIARMLLLKGHRDPAVSLLMFEARASLPVQGRVGYKIPGLVGVSTGYRTTVKLSLIGEIRVEKSGDRLSFGSPEVREMHVDIHNLRVSNDLLSVARDPLEDLVNHELRRNEERIRQQANKSLAKAVQSREFHHPLLRFLTLP